MKPHQQRVLDEKIELDNRINKLINFINSPIMSTVDNTEQSKLRIQLIVMNAYSTILNERLNYFKENEEI